MAWQVNVAEWVFAICLLLVIYTYFLYPFLLFLAYSFSQIRRDWHFLNGRRDRRTRWLANEQLPTVTLLIPAHDEQDCLPGKIANIRTLDYSQEKLQVIFVSDGSTDRTNDILQGFKDDNVRTIFLPERQGKAVALNHAVAASQSEILIMSDAATLFAPHAVRSLVRHFVAPKVGVVCGALQFQGTDESRQTEGLYWKYESMLRLMEGRLGINLTASGAIYALRRQCFLTLPANTLIEDLVIPWNARRLGFQVLYDPEATGTDLAAASVTGEFRRRVRLAVGSFRVLGELFRHGWRGIGGLAFFSHKLLRWFLPFLLLGLLVSNAWLWQHPVYQLALMGQMSFYLWAGMGFLFRDRLQHVRYALVGYFLLAMNLAFLAGFIRFLRGREEATWQRVR